MAGGGAAAADHAVPQAIRAELERDAALRPFRREHDLVVPVRAAGPYVQGQVHLGRSQLGDAHVSSSWSSKYAFRLRSTGNINKKPCHRRVLDVLIVNTSAPFFPHIFPLLSAVCRLCTGRRTIGLPTIRSHGSAAYRASLEIRPWPFCQQRSL